MKRPDMIDKDIEEILQRGEDSRIQFKARIDGAGSLAAEICALANTYGGYIFIGVSDNGDVVGVENVRDLNQWIANACSQKIEPPVGVTTENILVRGKLLVLINVPPGTNKPYAANKMDFWVKVGADKRRATREDFTRLMQASGNLFADETVVTNSTIADLDIFLFKNFYEREYGEGLDGLHLPIEKLFHNIKVMQDDKLTLAGLLLFGRHPEILKPQFVVKAVAFPGNDLGGNEYLDSEDIIGPLPQIYKNTIGFLKRNLQKKQKGRSVNFPGLLEIPQVALEEAVVNALIHRDYYINSSVRVFIFANRVEIISPGKLPNTVTTETIRYGIQIVRNPILLSFVTKLEIPYRGIGSGIIRMMKECRQAGIPQPVFEEDAEAEQFKVIFSR